MDARCRNRDSQSENPSHVPWKEYHERGVLMSYGPDLKDLTRRTAAYIAKIQKGVNLSDLPVEEVSKFDLVIRSAGRAGAKD